MTINIAVIIPTFSPLISIVKEREMKMTDLLEISV